MKKLFFIGAALVYSIGLQAQEAKPAPSADPAVDHPKGHECYMMKEGAMIHCMGKTSEAQKAEVKLTNGVVVSPDGQVVQVDGASVQMKNGQCVDLMGMIGDCGEMHKDLMKEPAEKSGM